DSAARIAEATRSFAPTAGRSSEGALPAAKAPATPRPATASTTRNARAIVRERLRAFIVSLLASRRSARLARTAFVAESPHLRDVHRSAEGRPRRTPPTSCIAARQIGISTNQRNRPR